MATKNYQWAAAVTVDSGGYTNEIITIEDNGTVLFSGSVNNPPQTFNVPWTTTTDETGSSTYTYTYRDSDTMNNNNCTKVAVTVKDEWSVSIDSHNVMTVTVHTIMLSAVRTLIGSITNTNRHIWMRRSSSGSDFSPFPLIDNASTSHTIATNVDMGTYSFTLQPGENATRASIWWRNTSVGYEDRPIPNIWTDILGVGIHFRNILPKDYRPGMTWDGGRWMSHDRNAGAANVKGSSNWIEMRTVAGGEASDNPPFMRYQSDWKNMRETGIE